MGNGDRKEGTTRQPCPSRPSSLAVGANFLGDSSAESVLVKLGKALVPIRSGRSNSCGVGLTLPHVGCGVQVGRRSRNYGHRLGKLDLTSSGF